MGTISVNGWLAITACLLMVACGRGEPPAASVGTARSSEWPVPRAEDTGTGDKRAKLQMHFAGRAIEPTMITVPGGASIIGCNTGKECRYDEKPVVEVRMASFALSRTEVTFEEWDACFADGGCKELPPDPLKYS